MPKLIWEKKLQEAVKRQQRFGWSVRNMRGKVFVQRYYTDINKKVTAILPIMWEPNLFVEISKEDLDSKINSKFEVLAFFVPSYSYSNGNYTNYMENGHVTARYDNINVTLPIQMAKPRQK